MAQSVEKTLLNARKLARRGEMEAARALYLAVLERFPKNKRARQGLDLLDMPAPAKPAPHRAAPPQERLTALIGLCEAGRHDEARRLGEDLARSFPGSVIVQNLLGAAHAGQGRMEDALACYRQAVRLGPGQSASHNNLGVALANLGRFEEAAASYRRAVELDPANADAHGNLGHCLHQQGQVEPALAAFRAALRLEPGHGDALANMAGLLIAQMRFDEAAMCCRAALSARPADVEARLLLGDALRDADPAAALDAYAQAAHQAPDLARAQRKLGQVLVDLGRVDEARGAFDRALELDPDDAATLHARGSITRLAEDDPEIARMASLTERSDATDRDQRYLHFALAKSCRDQGIILENSAIWSGPTRRASGYRAMTSHRMRRCLPT